MQGITFVTGNAQKAKQLSRHLNVELKHVKLNLAEIQSLDTEEIVRDKATRAYREIGEPVLVEDTSLTFHALGRLPGPLIKWFLESIGNKGLTQLLNSYKSRRALAACYFFACMMVTNTNCLKGVLKVTSLTLLVVKKVLVGIRFLSQIAILKHGERWIMRHKTKLQCVKSLYKNLQSI